MAQGVAARNRTRKRRQNGLTVRCIEVDAIIPPDSAVTREAIAISQDASSPFLFNHCLRAYFWARLLDNGSQSFDDEAVFTALMLHDLGLTERHRLRSAAEECFTVVGARSVAALAAKHNWSDRRAHVAGLGLDVLQSDQIQSVVTRYPRRNMKAEILNVLSVEARGIPIAERHSL